MAGRKRYLLLYIEALDLYNFRNFERIHLSFSKGINLVLGNNGVGKSNLLEAVYMLSTSKSFRNASDQKIVKWGSKQYGVRGTFRSENRTLEISIDYDGEKKSLAIDRMPERRISSIIGYVYCVLFFFEDIYLITGPPYARRNVLNLILSTVDPLYFSNLRSYVTVVKQKNRYLKEATSIDKTLLQTLNDQLAETGSYLLYKRLLLIDYVNSFIEKTLERCEDIVFPFRADYRSTVPDISSRTDIEGIKRAFLERLGMRMEKERIYAQSITGPHRDDVQFTDNRFSIRHFGSVGEARLSSIVLKLAQASYYIETRGVVPILLIDDVLLELDHKNMEHVLQMIGGETQMIITTTERIKLPETFSYNQVFSISDRGDITCKETSPQN